MCSASTAAERVAGRRWPPRPARSSACGKSGPANIRTDLSGARRNIVEAARLAFADAGADPELIPETAAVLGLAGSNVGTYAQQLEAILPFRAARVETDALIALEGAVGSGDGAIAVLGTGTAYMVRKGGVTRAIGGWGFQVGDQGSGARIGRDLLEMTLLAHDGIGAASPLTAEMMEVFRDDPQMLVEFTTNASPATSAASRQRSSSMPTGAMRWRRRSSTRRSPTSRLRWPRSLSTRRRSACSGGLRRFTQHGFRRATGRC